ncbi:MAG: hypothetical protein KAI24_21715, partial [Planctomycetes bacterium]|nr:hypothetical protein [Planctomycetota bacterium]
TEDRIDQLSGFPIELENGEPGWAGYHGIWFPEGTTLTDGQTVYRRSFETNERTPYTVSISPGRLEKRTRQSITWGDVIDEVFEYFNPNTGEDLQVKWTGQDFVKVGVRASNGYTAIDPAVSIASSFTTGEWVSCWSNARGQIEFTWPSSLSNTTPAFVWQNTTITADSAELANGDLTLYGYFNQLRANITSNQANFQSSETPYLPDATAVNSGNTDYTFVKSSLMLNIGSDPVNFGNGVTVTQGPGMFGLNCGPLFDAPLTSFNDISSRDTTYQWMIGSNSWNQLRTLKDSNGNFVTFTPPITMSYTHSETSSPYDGRTFFLQWDGTWLNGIPHEQDTNGNYYPVFNIPTGTTVTVGNNTYKLKQLEGEQTMVAVSSPSTVYTAQGFDIDGTPITEPTATPYQDPAIGERPVVTSAPKYVGGVDQTSSDS